MADDLYKDLLVELECAICTNYMSPPIRQCATGHSICNSCCQKLPACPLCQAKFNDARNIALEALAKKIRYPCLYQGSGCNVRLALDERDQHEAQCTFRGYKCMLPKCTWSGPSEDIPSHWQSKEKSSKPYQEKNVCSTKLKTDSYYVNLVQAYDQLFWYKFKSSMGKIQWCIQYIGSGEDADDYYYEIEIFKQGQPKSRILLSDYCQDLQLEQSEIFKAGNCVAVPVDLVSPFVGDDQVLIYYMRVFKVEEDTNGKHAERKKRFHKAHQQKHNRRDHSKHGTKANNDSGSQQKETNPKRHGKKAL